MKQQKNADVIQNNNVINFLKQYYFLQNLKNVALLEIGLNTSNFLHKTQTLTTVQHAWSKYSNFIETQLCGFIVDLWYQDSMKEK